MPELPEIEHLAASLRAGVVGRELVDVRCRQPKMLNLPLAEFARRARGPIVGAERRAKSCLLHLAEGSIWLHLGLGGEVTLAQAPLGDPQLALIFADGWQLLVDKTFMGHAHFLSEEETARQKQGYGPEPLQSDFGLPGLEALLRRRPKQAIKALLMDQARLAGVGNVYSDEVCHAARLYPARAAGSLDSAERRQLFQSLKSVLSEAVAEGGASEYADVRGERGRYEMRIHGAELCRICGTPAGKVSIGGRTAYYCPACQRSQEAVV